MIIKENRLAARTILPRVALLVLPLSILSGCMSAAISDVASNETVAVQGLPLETTTQQTAEISAQPNDTDVASDETATQNETAANTPSNEQILQSVQPVSSANNEIAALIKQPADLNASQQSIYASAQVAAPPAKEPPRKFTLASLFAPQPKKPAFPEGQGLIKPAPSTAPEDGASSASEEDDDRPAGLMKLVSAPSLARIAANGLWIQTSKVDTHCFKPDLIAIIRKVERHYGKPAVVTSGYRDVKHNRRAGGSSFSRHTTCDAADIQVKDVSKWELAEYLRSLPNRGGVGTYCHTKSVHIDTGSERDWNWRCRRRKK